MDPAVWEHVGSRLLEVLTALKHNGAIEKTQAGFHGLCVRQEAAVGCCLLHGSLCVADDEIWGFST